MIASRRRPGEHYLRLRRDVAALTPLLPPNDELVEIFDARNRPLGVMPLSDAHRQGLRHRTVLVLVFDPEGRVYLQKRSRNKQFHAGKWDLSATGHVQAGESREGAALRELEEELGLTASGLTLWEEVPAGPENGFEFVTLYSAGRFTVQPAPNAYEIEDGHFFDHDEVAYLTSAFPEMVTPGLAFFWNKGGIFPQWKLE